MTLSREKNDSCGGPSQELTQLRVFHRREHTNITRMVQWLSRNDDPTLQSVWDDGILGQRYLIGYIVIVWKSNKDFVGLQDSIGIGHAY